MDDRGMLKVLCIDTETQLMVPLGFLRSYKFQAAIPNRLEEG